MDYILKPSFRKQFTSCNESISFQESKTEIEIDLMDILGVFQMTLRFMNCCGKNKFFTFIIM